MVHFLELLYFLIILKAILRTLHFWQLKEYRWDRFKEFLTTPDANRYFLPTRYFLRPRLTVKVLLLVYLTFYFHLFILNLFPSNSVFQVVLAYLAAPLTASISVALLSPITSLLYDLIIFLAKIKLSLLQKNLTVIGITGSFGKTATKEILAHLLADKFRVLKTPDTKNTAVGVALTIIKSLKSSHQVFVVEMGAYKIGEIKKICKLVRPKIGILTGIGKQHLGLFGSFNQLKQAKYELIAALPPDGLAVFNGQNQYTRKLAKATKHVKSKLFRLSPKPIKTNLLGDYQQENIAAAITVAKHLGLKRSSIQKRLLTVPRFITQINQYKGKTQATIINDVYNANPDGFLAAIKLAKTLKFSQKILITPGIIETGSLKVDLHHLIAKSAFTVFNEIIITKKDIFDIFNKIKSKSVKLTYQPNLKALLNYLKPKLNQNTLILLEGKLHQKLVKSL